MKTLDFIVSYLKTEATVEEKQVVLDSLIAFKHPPLNVEHIIKNLIYETRTRFVQIDGYNRLGAVKFVKEQMNWGLKEAKDFCDNYVF